jgi:transcription antitermination factor NusG
MREGAAAHFLQLAKYQVYLPRLRVVRAHRGRKVELRRPLFPSYLFLVIERGWWAARWSPHVVRLLAAGDGPMPVPDAVIAGIKGREHNGLVELPKREVFKVGDQVRITTGAMCGLEGLVAQMRSNERVAILLQALGRIELQRDGVELVPA